VNFNSLKKHFKSGNAWIVIAFLLMAILFYSSGQTYEKQSQVSNIHHWFKSEPFKEALRKIDFWYAGHRVSLKSLGYAKLLEFFLRKGAHFTIFFALATSWYLGLTKKMKSCSLVALISWLSATGYGGLDEFHQLVTGGRSPLIEDVMVDSSGAACAILLILLIHCGLVLKK